MILLVKFTINKVGRDFYEKSVHAEQTFKGEFTC